MEIVSFLFAVLAFLGSTGVMGAFIVFMMRKHGWKAAQIVAGMVFAMLLVSSAPSLPQAVNNGVTGVIHSISAK